MSPPVAGETGVHDVFLRLDAVLARVGLSRSTVYALIKAKRFPAPVKLTAHASGWRARDVQAWARDPVAWRSVGVNAE